MDSQLTVAEPRIAKDDVPAVGAHGGVPFEVYCRWRATNWHTLKPFDVSALQGRHEMTMPSDSTKDLIFGGAFHAAMLEPDKFAADYATMPRFEGHPNSNAYKAQKQEWIDANRTKVSLTIDEMERIKGMQAAVYAHPTASALVSGKGRNELSIVWRDAATGELCKGRIDRLTRIPAKYIDATATGDVICEVDFKKTAFLHRFDNEVQKYGYHGQRAFYKDGLQTLAPGEVTSIIVAVQDEEPFDVVCFSCADAVEHGRRLYRRLLNTLVSCRKSDRWPGMRPKGTMPIILPKFALEAEEPT